ncbi:MAG: hypothetical protein ACOZHQ_00995 [Thermodesulfobacteriota bacterium]
MRYQIRLPLLLGVVLALAGCAAGPQGPFGADNPAGFWAGLWHGFIAWLTFIISLFGPVQMYATHNTGAWYDFGFLLGMAVWLGGGSGSMACRCKSRDEQEWDEVAEKVEAKLKREMRGWAEAQDSDDWPAVEKKLEEKLRRKLREWADS